MAKFEAGMEAMADMYVFETTTLLEQLDQILMKTENESSFGEEEINEIFRTMHTIKGSSAMMGLENMSKLAHAIEDMFYVIREDNPVITSMETLYDIVFNASDLMKAEIELLQEDEYTATDFSEQITKIKAYAAVLKGEAAPEAVPAAAAPAAPATQVAPAVSANAPALTAVKVYFEDDCKMENLRALLVINRITDACSKLEYVPADIETNGDTAQVIIETGFDISFAPADGKTVDAVVDIIRTTPNVKKCDIVSRGADVAVAKAASGDTTSVRVYFEDDCKMENLRALLVVNTIKEVCDNVTYVPADIENNADTCKTIIEEGFLVNFTSEKPQLVFQTIESTPCVKSYEVIEDAAPKAEVPKAEVPKATPAAQAAPVQAAAPKAEAPKVAVPAQSKEQINNAIATKGGGAKQSLISVNLNKLDTLVDLVGEIVITEAMVTSNPDLKGLRLDNFQKAARQLRKLNSELQDAVMSIRMVPISGAFNKMTRIVRDMKVKLNKDVDLIFEGEETEVDKSIIDQLNDPLMHMVRNSMDHGIEDNVEDRIAAGKSPKGKITLSAYNASGEVIIVIADDGGGINPEKVLAKAEKNGILSKPANEYSEKEILNMIMLPGFSTNEQVTEYWAEALVWTLFVRISKKSAALFPLTPSTVREQASSSRFLSPSPSWTVWRFPLVSLSSQFLSIPSRNPSRLSQASL